MAEGKRWADIKQAHRNTRATCRIPMDAAAIAEAEALEPVLRRLRSDDGEHEDLSVQVRETAERIDLLQQQARESEVEFVFEGVGRARHEKMMIDNPPTDAQQAEVKRDNPDAVLPWNPETFPPALLAASCVEPEDLAGHDTAWTEIHNNWSTGQVARLWRACRDANQGVNETPKSLLASAILAQLDSEQS